MNGPPAPGVDLDGVRTAVVVAPSPVPLRIGGAERHWSALCRALVDSGVSTDVVKLPVRENDLLDLVDGYESFLRLDLSHVDLVISGKYPAWMTPHPRHVVWMLHPLRGLYDTWDARATEDAVLPATADTRDLSGLLARPAGTVPPLELIDAVRRAAEELGPDATAEGPPGSPPAPLALLSPVARAVTHHLDRWALDPSRIAAHAAISDTVARRSDYFPDGVPVATIHPPSSLPEPEPRPPGTTLLCVGRLDRPKRVDLVIEAMAAVADPTARLEIVGEGADRDRLVALAAGDPRIAFLGRLDDTELARAYLDSRAVVVTPAQEDFGYVTIEAMQHGRAVITTTDSGGPAELTVDGRDSLHCAPEPADLAAAMQRLLGDPALALRLGDEGRSRAAEHRWPRAVSRLLALRPTAIEVAPGRRGRIVAVSTYPLDGHHGGGPERARHLLGALAERGWDVTAICLTDDDAAASCDLADGLHQIVVAPSARHRRAELLLHRVTGDVPIGDIAASVLWPSDPEFVGLLRRHLRGAAAALAVQPFLAPALDALGPDVPLVYDSHNHEHALKEAMLPPGEAGEWMLARVAEAESLAVRRAALVTVTTPQDSAALAPLLISLATAPAAPKDHVPPEIVVVPNGVDLGSVASDRARARDDVLASLAPSARRDHLALFVGSAHRPNVVAARAICAFATELADVTLVLAGNHTDALGTHALPANVVPLGEVDDGRLAELLAGCDLALNPMVDGGGSNLKILQYFAAGLPVITTPVGARSIPDPHRVAVVVPLARFPAAIRESLNAPDRGRVDAARALAEQSFDWSGLGATFATAVAEAIGAAEAPPKSGSEVS